MCHRVDTVPGLRRGGSVGKVTGSYPSFPSLGDCPATHGCCILDLSASSLGSTGAQRGCRAKRGQQVPIAWVTSAG